MYLSQNKLPSSKMANKRVEALAEKYDSIGLIIIQG